MKNKFSYLIIFISLFILSMGSTGFAKGPVITQQPTNQGAIVGQAIGFTLIAKSDTSIDTLHYQWYKNGALITGATDSLYNTTATIADSGSKFYCMVTNDSGSVNSDTVILYVTSSGSRVTSSEVAAFNFKEFGGSTIHDVSGRSPSDSMSISDTNGVKWSQNGLTVRNPDYIYTPNTETKIVSACDSTNELTVELWVVPAKLNLNNVYIASLQSSNNNRDFTVFQNYQQLAVKVRITPSTSLSGEPFISTTSYPIQQRLMQIVYTRKANGVGKIYVDGSEIASDSLPGTFTDWSSTSKLGLAGNNPAGNNNWLGTYYYMGIYNRALSSAEVSHNYTVGVTTDTLPVIVFQPQDTSIIAGQAAAFRVRATGITSLTYQWQKNGIDIPGATNSSYTTPILNTSDNLSTYRVIVHTDYDSIMSNSAKVFITPANARVSYGLQALYNFQDGSGNTIHDVSGVGTPINLTINTPSAVVWKPYGLDVTAKSYINSVTAPARLYDSLSNTNQITIEAWIKPATSNTAGWIVTCSQDSANRNFLLYGLSDNNYYGRLRTTTTNDKGIPFVNTTSGSADSLLTHLVYTFDSEGNASIYVNGALIVDKYIGGNFSNWNKNYLFGIANEIIGNEHWTGLYNLVAIYDRALTPGEVSHNYSMGPVGNITVKGPGNLKAQAIAPGKVSLSWADSSNNEDGFIIERKEVSPVPSNYAVLDTVPTNTTTLIDSMVADTTTYSYRVKAFNMLSMSTYSSEATVKTLLSSLAAPTNLQAMKNTPDTTQIKLTWVDNSSNEFGFIIQRKTGDSLSTASFNNIDTTAVNQTSFVDKHLNDTTIYTYRVYAYNQFSTSSFSNIVQIKSALTTIAKPTDLTANKRVPDSTHVILTWKDNSSNEDGFIIERKLGDSTSTNSYVKIDTLSANKTSFADTTTADSTTYTYKVYAYNSFHSSEFSNLAQVTTASKISGIAKVAPIPKEFSLGQNYPNPFNPSTRIQFALPVEARVTLTIYNTLGQEVTRLYNSVASAGVHEINFNATRLSSGIYFYRIVANGVNGKQFISTKRMLLLK